jgi:calcineurin-like phosphoesterase family protein
MSNIFFVSDTHFSHFNVIRYCMRPYSSAQEMDENLIANWNTIVKENDIIYHLGDFAFCRLQEIKNILRRLNGNIHMILGNHDKSLDENWEDILDDGKIISMRDYRCLKINKQKIVLSHYAMRVWDGSHIGSWHLYAHSHGTLPPFGLSVDVGVDCKEITSEYRPVSLDEVRDYMSKRTTEIVDHHGCQNHGVIE